jgi:hypothetical protein
VIIATSAFALPAPAPTTDPYITKVSGEVCTTVAAGSRTKATVTVSDTRMIDWEATDDSGTAVTVKRFLATGNTAYRKASSGKERVDLASSTFAFGRLSSTSVPITSSTAINICVDKH